MQGKFKSTHLHMYFTFSTVFSSWLALLGLHQSHGTPPPLGQGHWHWLD